MGNVSLEVALAGWPIGGVKRAVKRYNASELYITIPSWFDCLRDTLYVTGCGGGGGSAGSNASFFGGAGAAPASAVRLPLKLGTHSRTLKADIGIGGNGGASGVAGTSGGSTILNQWDAGLTEFKPLLTLGGGAGGNAGTDNGHPGGGGRPRFHDTSYAAIRPWSSDTATSSMTVNAFMLLQDVVMRTVPEGGVVGFDGHTGGSPTTVVMQNSPDYAANTPTPTPFGGGLSLSGYGFGGARCPTKTVATGRPGAAGFLILEFEQG